MHARPDLEWRLASRWDAAFEVGGVHELAPHANLLPGACEAKHDVVPVSFATHVVAAGQEAGPPGRQEVILYHVGEVGVQLVGTGEFVKAGIHARTVNGVLAQRNGIDAVEGRRLVQAQEWIGIEPVSPGRVATVDQCDAGIALGQRRIGHRHSRRAGSNHQVIRFNQVRPVTPLMIAAIPNCNWNAEFSVHKFPIDTSQLEGYIEQVIKPNVQCIKSAHEHPRGVRTDGVATRDLILQAARRRLIEEGYANLSVREIAADAGVNHALIGYHFQGKQQLVMAVLDEANARLLERQERMYNSAGSASEQWQQACAFYDADLASGFVKLLMELMGASFHDEALRREFTPRLLAWQKLIEEAVDRFVSDTSLALPISARAISAGITWFWMGMEASMALGIDENEGHQREALAAMTTLLQRAEAGTRRRRQTPRKTRT